MDMNSYNYEEALEIKMKSSNFSIRGNIAEIVK